MMEGTIRTHHRKKAKSRTQATKKACRKAASSATLWSLPQEVLLDLFQHLPIRELLNLNCTHPYFHDLITNNPSVWQTVSFHGTWPTVPNMKHFIKAAEHSNFEALVKLGIAFLYNEGLPGDFEGRKITTNGERAAEMFCKVETSTPAVSPFTWLFIRPPWAVAGACCKECVFNNMKEYVTQTPDASVHICIAKTMGILGVDDYKEEIERHLTLAKGLGSQEAAFMLWTYKYCQCCRVLDCAAALAGMRDLRQIAMSGYYEAQLCLCKRYATGQYGGYNKASAVEFTRNFIQSSSATHVKDIYRFNELTHSMRYILMDWLVEVACMKDFSSLTLHMAISVVDRFLQKHKTTRAKLQLLGVAAMVLCSRVLGTEIITIREAAWLTDNTYKYEDVVRMMGEITSALHGKFRVPVSLDYVELLLAAAPAADRQTTFLAEYFCELALLQSDTGDFPMAQVAASSVLLARIVLKNENPWPAEMVKLTGFTVTCLAKLILLILDKCFMDQAMVDHRDVVLQAVKERYADEEFMSVSSIKVMTKAELHVLLGLPEDLTTQIPDAPQSPAKPRLSSPKDLIASPCRGGGARVTMDTSSVTMDQDREQAATPTLQEMKHNSSSSKLNESVSGYEGDLEDEGESFIETNGYDSDDPDFESLWCTERKWCDSRVDLSSGDDDCSFRCPGGALPVSSISIPNPTTSLVPNGSLVAAPTTSASSPQLVGSMSLPVGSFTFGGVSPFRITSTVPSSVWSSLNTPKSRDGALPDNTCGFLKVNKAANRCPGLSSGPTPSPRASLGVCSSSSLGVPHSKTATHTATRPSSSPSTESTNKLYLSKPANQCLTSPESNPSERCHPQRRSRKRKLSSAEPEMLQDNKCRKLH